MSIRLDLEVCVGSTGLNRCLCDINTFRFMSYGVSWMYLSLSFFFEDTNDEIELLGVILAKLFSTP